MRIKMPMTTDTEVPASIDPQHIKRSKAARAARATLHKAPRSGRAYIAIDTSGSMGYFHGVNKIEEAKTALRQVSHSYTDMTIISFGTGRSDASLPYGIRVLQKDEIDSLHSGGGTPMMGALETAYGMAPRPTELVLITDGEPTDAGEEQILQWAITTRPFKIHTIAIGNDANEQFLSKLSEVSGGVFGQVAEVAGQLSSELTRLITATAGQGAITL